MMSELQDRLMPALDDLRDGLFQASQLRLRKAILNPERVRSAVGEADFDSISARTDRVACLGQMDAVCRFLLEILYPAGIGEGVDNLLAAESDAVDGLGEFANLRVLRALLESGGDGGSGGDISTRLFKCLSLCEHNASPNCSARVPDTRGSSDVRRGSGGSPNAARHF